MTVAPEVSTSPQEQLSDLFGSYKAEWLRERMFDLFTEPSYLPELTTPRPCMLIGGRGTGKTTVLRCLSYEGQFALRGRIGDDMHNWPSYGLYYRVNTNRVTAFKGPELTEDRWAKVFGHYFNIVLCDLMLGFLEWYQLQLPDSPQLTAADCASVAVSLHLPKVESVRLLAENISRTKIGFEAYINNVADNDPVPLSLQGAPVDALFEAVARLPQFSKKNFFFLLDEYENFEDYQQQVVNTLIKHAGQVYTFKVGVRELGWRRRSTLNKNEQLISPSDYVRIHIAEKLEGDRFSSFARNVFSERLSRIKLPGSRLLGVRDLFPGLSAEKEAEILDIRGDSLAREAATALASSVPSKDKILLDKLPLLNKYFLVFWADAKGLSLEEVWRDFSENQSKWDTRYRNYKHALLFTLRRGKRGVQKYYTGWTTFIQLSGLNIRYLLELVDQSLLLHFQDGFGFDHPVSPEVQTRAAQSVGKKNLAELEGLSIHGAQLTKLLLGLGRVFQTLALEPKGHTPEVNQFHVLDESPENSDEDLNLDERVNLDRLLSAAVMHLALLRYPGSKLADERDTRDYDYTVHPIFSAFFVFPYRRKRKMKLTGRQLLGLVRDPKKAIRDILQLQNRSPDEPLPDQLMLFEAYYRG